MTPRTVRETVDGPAGRIECAVDRPEAAPRGLAVICHPHPPSGGTLDNKVVQTIARACLGLGWASVRFNFRGIGASEGTWDDGRGEVDDALAVIAAWRARPEFAGVQFVLAGFDAAARPRRLVLVGPSTEKQPVGGVPADTLVIHGESDDVVPLAATLDWARPQNLPVIVFPGVGHFFHGQLGLLKTVIVRELRDLDAV